MARDTAPLDLLAQIPLFSACTDRQLRRIWSLGHPMDVEAGDLLTEEGKPGADFYVVEEGTAQVTLRDRKLAELGPGDFFGEMALLDQGPRSATVTATTPMRVYVFGAREFSALLDDAPDVGKKILKGVGERLRAIQGARVSPRH